MNLPPRTVERLSKYRRLLEKLMESEENYIFSHQLARMLNLTPVQVRRDLMLVGFSGNHRKGYNINELLELIGHTIDREEGHNIAIVGMGNLGRAVTRFIRKNHSRMNIVASFDIDQSKINDSMEGVPCYNVSKIDHFIKKLGIDIIVLTASSESAQQIVDEVIASGVKGILNFTSAHLVVPKNIYLKDYDIITSLEEIGFFIKNP